MFSHIVHIFPSVHFWICEMERDFRSSTNLFSKEKYICHSFFCHIPQYCFLHFIVSELMLNVIFFFRVCFSFSVFLKHFFCIIEVRICLLPDDWCSPMLLSWMVTRCYMYFIYNILEKAFSSLSLFVSFLILMSHFLCSLSLCQSLWWLLN